MAPVMEVEAQLPTRSSSVVQAETARDAYCAMAAQKAFRLADHALAGLRQDAHVEASRACLKGAGSSRSAAQAYNELRGSEALDREDGRMARIEISEALALFCIAKVGHTDREAFDSELAAAFCAPLDDKTASQLHNTFRHLVETVPGAFRSGNVVKGRKRSKRQGHGTGGMETQSVSLWSHQAQSCFAGCAGEKWADMDPNEEFDVRVRSSFPTTSMLPEPQAEPEVTQCGPQSRTYVPCELDCSRAARVQIEALLQSIVDPAVSAEECWHSIEALDHRLLELRLCDGSGSQASFQLADMVADELSKIMVRHPTVIGVQSACMKTLVELLSARGDILGLQVTKCDALNFREVTRLRIEGHMWTLLADSVFSDIHCEALQLLSRTQPLTNVFNDMRDNDAIMDGMLTEIHSGLLRYLEWLTAGNCSSQKQQFGTLFLLEVSKQQAMPEAQLGTEKWIGKVYNKDQKKLRFMSVGLLFGVREILVPLMQCTDSTELIAANDALKDLNSLKPFSPQTALEVVDFLLKRGSCDDQAVDVSLECRASSIGMLGSLLGDSRTAPAGDWDKELMREAVEEAFAVCELCAKIDGSHTHEHELNVALRALDEMLFTGEAERGLWQHSMCDVARWLIDSEGETPEAWSAAWRIYERRDW